MMRGSRLASKTLLASNVLATFQEQPALDDLVTLPAMPVPPSSMRRVVTAHDEQGHSNVVYDSKHGVQIAPHDVGSTMV
jgi:hypothetical protein